MRFVVLLALVALLPIVGAGGYLAGQALAPDDPSVQVQQPKWIYGPRETYATAQKGMIVYCQGKTNAPKFAAREYAKPGDVVIQTCRAVKDPSGKTSPSG